MSGTRCVAALVVGLGLLAGQARADIAGPEALIVRLARAQAACLGTVERFEEKTLRAKLQPGDAEPVDLQIMVVKVQQSLRGLEGETHVRVAFLPQDGKHRETDFSPPEQGSKACFFLRRHHQEPCYVVTPFFDVVTEKAPGFEEQVRALEQMSKALAQPAKALTSKNVEERVLAAGLLILQYRDVPQAAAQGVRQEPIDARESKLILEALRDADWSRPYTDIDVNAFELFTRLNPTRADGWEPKDFAAQADHIAAAKKWLTEKSGSYRIQRFVR